MRIPRKRGGESAVLRQCLQFLALHKIFHWRCNSGGGLRPNGRGGMRPIVGAPAGTPDILAVCPEYVAAPGPGGTLALGRLVGIEVKRPGGKRSAEQIAWAERASAVGVLCLVVESDRELEEALRREGYIT